MLTFICSSNILNYNNFIMVLFLLHLALSILFFISLAVSEVTSATRWSISSCPFSCCGSNSDDDVLPVVGLEFRGSVPRAVPIMDAGDMVVEDVAMLPNPLVPLDSIKVINMPLSDVRILIVEDNNLCVITLQRFCKQHSFKDENVVIAENGKIGVDLFQSFKPHIVFMDRNMPKKDGIKATKEIRDLQDIVGIVPIIICISDDNTNQCVIDFKEAGADDFCHKPIKSHDFGEVLAKHVKIPST